MMTSHESYMYRCLELAARGAGYVAPNPMVGAVLVHQGRIIGEGWHHKYGEAHAEVNCINDAIANGLEALIPDSVLYVSLEPCVHFGKTPPCADLIIKLQIPRVVIGCRDPFKEVDGRGIEKLKAAGIETITGILEEQCREINKRFFVFHTQHRPYVILKWAQTSDGIIGYRDSRLLISNEYSNKLVHRWRSEEASILVGTKTALADNPALTNRLWPGPSPVRLVIDTDLKLPGDLRIFSEPGPVVIFNSIKHSYNGDGLNLMKEKGGSVHYKIDREKDLIPQLLDALYTLNLQSIIIEGGARLLQSFIDANAWDEARVIVSASNVEDQRNSIPAPRLKRVKIISLEALGTDKIQIMVPA